jgi:hypothetical protein
MRSSEYVPVFEVEPNAGAKASSPGNCWNLHDSRCTHENIQPQLCRHLSADRNQIKRPIANSKSENMLIPGFSWFTEILGHIRQE